MGVTILQPYPLPEGKSGAHIIDQLSKRLLALGATHAGQFLVDCETFISTPQPHNGAPGLPGGDITYFTKFSQDVVVSTHPNVFV